MEHFMLINFYFFEKSYHSFLAGIITFNTPKIVYLQLSKDITKDTKKNKNNNKRIYLIKRHFQNNACK